MKKTIKEFEKAFIVKAVGALNDQVLKDKEMRQVKGGNPIKDLDLGPEWPWPDQTQGMIPSWPPFPETEEEVTF